MFGAVMLAFASSGGGKKKNSASTLQSTFTPIRTTKGFTMKAGPAYTGSHIFNSRQTTGFVMYNTVVTYQKGNVIFILPYQYKMNKQTNLKSNMNVLDLKIKLRK